MKVLIVFTHPNANSFNHALLEKVSAGLKSAGHEVKIKDLYKENFDPVLGSNDLSQLQNGNTPSRISTEQSDLTWADSLIFIYPLWWFTPPAMLKGWFDSVLTNGFAFKYGADGATGLLKHKRAQLLITAGSPKTYFDETNSVDLIYRPVTEGTLSFCGIENISHKVYYDLGSLTDEERQAILDGAELLGKNF